MNTYSLLAAAVLAGTTSAFGQISFSFESGFDGWAVSGFNAKPVSLANSAIGATDGLQSLAVTQTGGGFSWNIVRNNSGADAFYSAMNAASMNASAWKLELDVTYRDASIPDDPGLTFLNMSLWLNSDAPNFPNIHSYAFTTGHEDKTIHLSIPLTTFANPPLAQNSSYYQMGIGMNGNWGPGDATIYIDNIQIVPEPHTGLLLFGGILGLGLAARRFKRAAAK